MHSHNPVYIHFGEPTLYDNHHGCQICDPEDKGLIKRLKEFFGTNKSQKNKIISTRYSLLTIFPMSFLNQFRRKANIYFSFIFAISLTKYSSRKPMFSFIPIFIVLSFSILKDFYEFMIFRKEDKKVNESPAMRFNKEGNKWDKIVKGDIEPGDILLVHKDNEIPADVILLKSEFESGLCSINTASLDGETNLKIKRSIEGVDFMDLRGENGIDSPASKRGLKGFVQSDAPSARMDSKGWKGLFHYKDDKNEMSLPLDMSQFLIRGSVLKNTQWVICLVVFTGPDTKMQQQNTSKKLFTESKSEKQVEKFIVFLLICQVILMILGSVLNFLFYQNKNLWYFRGSFPSTADYFAFSFSILSLLETNIPISLYIVLEVTKLIHAFNINKDTEMKKAGGKHAKTRTSNLVDEIGRVNIIFSDKTGTLTKNKMAFSRCSLGGLTYAVSREEEGGNHRVNQSLTALLRNGNHRATAFFQLMSLCHTALTDATGCSSSSQHVSKKISYQAESPDEKALIEAAAQHGFIFTKRYYGYHEISGTSYNIEFVECDFLGRKCTLKILDCFGFDSERKRNSVVVEDEEGKIRVYTKGAESVLFGLLSEECKAGLWEKTSRDIDDFSKIGLRVLACAFKEVSRDAFLGWHERYKEAQRNLNNEEEVDRLVAEMESGLTLLGATAVEDQLQDEVPNTLQLLYKAGIVIYILTGDKMQTALNIAKSCKLLTPEMRYYPNIIILDCREGHSDEEALRHISDKLHNAWEHLENKSKNDKHQAFVISGRAMGLIFPKKGKKNKNKKKKNKKRNREEVSDDLKALQILLLESFEKCRVVICCRVSPFQKSQLVDLHKSKNKSDVVLAVGDGANDVPMLKLANIGVGIAGKEGLQASRASDFCVYEFKDLKSLLLYHGAINCSRISKLINFSFYKNICITALMFVYFFHSGFSNSIVIPQEALSIHNLIYTHIPIFMISLFDAPYTRSNAFRFPFLYERGPRNELLTFFRFILNVLLAIAHSLVVFFVLFFAFPKSFVGSRGEGMSFCFLSFASFNSIVAVITASAFLEAESCNVYLLMSLFYTTPAWAIITFALNFNGGDNYGCAVRGMQQPVMWIAAFVSVVLCCLPSLLFTFFKTFNCPSNYQIARELESKHVDMGVRDLKLQMGSGLSRDLRDNTVGVSDNIPKEGTKVRWRDFVKSKLLDHVVTVE